MDSFKGGEHVTTTRHRPYRPVSRSLIGQPQIMDISIAMTFRTGNGSCGGWSYSVWVL